MTESRFETLPAAVPGRIPARWYYAFWHIYGREDDSDAVLLRFPGTRSRDAWAAVDDGDGIRHRAAVMDEDEVVRRHLWAAYDAQDWIRARSTHLDRRGRCVIRLSDADAQVVGQIEEEYNGGDNQGQGHAGTAEETAQADAHQDDQRGADARRGQVGQGAQAEVLADVLPRQG